MKKGTIFIDLDGTILDVSRRIYYAYRNIMKKAGMKILSKEEYVTLKRNKTSWQALLQKTKAQGMEEIFKTDYTEIIEKPSYLRFDSIKPHVKETLSKLKNEFNIILITLREEKDNLFRELKEKKISDLFDEIIVISGRNCKEKYKLKSKLIKKYNFAGKLCVIVGDTETDILAGRELGIKTIAVSSGMRDPSILSKLNPDFLIDDIRQLVNILNNISAN